MLIFVTRAKSLAIGISLIALATLANTTQADGQADVTYFSAAQLRAKVTSTKDGLAFDKLPTGTNATVLMVRRDKDGEVEVHTTKEDVLVGHAGAASILVGGRVEGNHATAPDEWRGGRIIGGHTYNLAPGDMIWIPAGVPHQLLVKQSSSFSYLALKFDAKSAAQSQ